MLPQKQPSTLQTYKPEEEWEVTCDGKTFIITGSEAEVIRQAATKGQRGIIFFKDKAISIPHISSMFRLKKRKLEQVLPEIDITEEQRKLNEKNLEKLREQYGLIGRKTRGLETGMEKSRFGWEKDHRNEGEFSENESERTSGGIEL